jgi:hypothetical protein
MKQAVGLRCENGGVNPGRLPWAGMSQAVGLKAKPPAAQTHRVAGGVCIWLLIYKRGSNAPIPQPPKNSVLRPAEPSFALKAGQTGGVLLASSPHETLAGISSFSRMRQRSDGAKALPHTFAPDNGV